MDLKFVIITLIYIYIYVSVFKCNFYLNMLRNIQMILLGFVTTFFFVMCNIYVYLTWHYLLLLPISFILSLFNKRYVCLAYTYPVFCIIYKFLYNDKLVCIDSFILLIGIMHVIEGIMLFNSKEYIEEYYFYDLKIKDNGIKKYLNFYIMPVYLPIITSKHLYDLLISQNITLLEILKNNDIKKIIFAPIFLIICYSFFSKCNQMDISMIKRKKGSIVLMYGLILIIFFFIIRSNIRFENICLILVLILHELAYVYSKISIKMS